MRNLLKDGVRWISDFRFRSPRDPGMLAIFVLCYAVVQTLPLKRPESRREYEVNLRFDPYKIKTDYFTEYEIERNERQLKRPYKP